MNLIQSELIIDVDVLSTLPLVRLLFSILSHFSVLLVDLNHVLGSHSLTSLKSRLRLVIFVGNIMHLGFNCSLLYLCLLLLFKIGILALDLCVDFFLLFSEVVISHYLSIKLSHLLIEVLLQESRAHLINEFLHVRNICESKLNPASKITRPNLNSLLQISLVIFSATQHS